MGWESFSRYLGFGKYWEAVGERELERKIILKFVVVVIGRLMMLLLDMGMLGRRVSFVGMINGSGRDIVRY